MKKASTFLLIAITIISCNRPDFSNPEDVVKHYQELAVKNRYEGLYEDYLSSKSKELATKDEFIKNRQRADKIKIKNIEQKIIAYPTDINKASYRRFNVLSTILFEKDTIKANYYYTLINENGNWKIIWTSTLHSFADKKFSQGNYAEARATLEKIIEIDPFNGKAYGYLAWVYQRDRSLPDKERENGIMKNAKYALTLEENNPTHYNTMATYFRTVNNPDLAIQYLERGLPYCTDHYKKATFYSNISLDYLTLKNYAKAEEAIKKAIEIRANYTFAWYRYGLIMQNQGKNDTAMVYLEKAISLPEMDNALQHRLYYCYAHCCYESDKCNTAKEYITKALDLDPSNEDYQSLYAQLKYCKERNMAND